MSEEKTSNGKLAYSPKELGNLTCTSHKQIYEEIKAGRLRKTKMGRKTLFLKDDVEAWLQGLRQETNSGNGGVVTDSTDDLINYLEGLAVLKSDYEHREQQPEWKAAQRLRTLEARALPEMPENWRIDLLQEQGNFWICEIVTPDFSSEALGGAIDERKRIRVHGLCPREAVANAITKIKEQDHGS